MVILGLTGSIAMGKSTAAGIFRGEGAAVFDADRSVHQLLGRSGKAVPTIAAVFTGVVVNGQIDRPAMARQVFSDPAALSQLEAILHPLVRAEVERFLRIRARRRTAVAILDVPLLFESGMDRMCDAVVVVSAPAFLQEARMLARPGMDRDRLRAILKRQMSDGEKRRRADIVIRTGLSIGHTRATLRRVMEMASTLMPQHWPPKRTLER